MKFILIIMIFALVSCDLVTTRDAEAPELIGSKFSVATTPVILFQNLSFAFEEKILENYSACFIDQAFLKRDFEFIPSSNSESQYPVLRDWNFDAEKQYFNNLINTSSKSNSLSLKLSNLIATPQGDSAVYQYDYKISLAANESALPSEFSGTALFKILLDSRNQWVIVEIQDIKKDNIPSWSDLRGRLY